MTSADLDPVPLRNAADAAVPNAALRAAFSAPLQAAAMAAALAQPGAEVEAVLQTGSTNADLLARARQRAPARLWLRAALAQSAGRGRLGRRWHAAPGAALLFSVALPLPAQAPAPGAVTLAAGVALAEALAPLAALQLKWPNDLLLDGAKLGGVLAQLAVDAAGARTLVLGAGINLWLDPAARGSIGQPAAALAARVPLARLAAEREQWIGHCAAALQAAVGDCAAQGFVPFQPRFMRRFAFLGRPVELMDHGCAAVRGKALGVDGDGRLLLERDGRITAVASGDLSLRAAADAADAAGAAAPLACSALREGAA